MKNQFKYIKQLLNKNNIKVNKYTIKGKSTIVNTSSGNYVIKENKGTNIYNYLLSRNFKYIPRILHKDNNYLLIEYLTDTKYDKDQRVFDLIHLTALLHSKTTYYKEINYDENKKLYESIKNKINYINNYYLDLINNIESKIYMSPYEYLIARNISKILSCIFYCNKELDKYYEIVKDKKRKRVVTLHNNLKLDNIIKNENTYLISWDKSKVDLPIYDLVNFYNRYSLYFDYTVLFNEYERIFPLLEEEKILLKVLISIPDKIENNFKEYEMVKKSRELIDKIYKTEKLLTSKEKETTST